MPRAECLAAIAAFLDQPILVEATLPAAYNKPPEKQHYINPNELVILFHAYRSHTKVSGYKVNGFVGTKYGAEEVMFVKEKPLTIVGFKAWLAMNMICSGALLQAILDNEKNLYPAYVEVSGMIRDIISADQIEGAMSGVYKENLVARIQGLADKKEESIKHEWDITLELNPNKKQKTIQI